jgi:hypothetical protein
VAGKNIETVKKKYDNSRDFRNDIYDFDEQVPMKAIKHAAQRKALKIID